MDTRARLQLTCYMEKSYQQNRLLENDRVILRIHGEENVLALIALCTWQVIS